MIYRICFLLFLTVSVIYSCKKYDHASAFSGNHIANLPAGECTVFDESSFAFGYRINGLSTAQNLDFFVGNSFFNQNWVEAPSSTTARDGLGPLFNTKSCAGCHFRDGRGAPLSGEGMLFRLSINDNGQFIPEPIYGGQFQDNSISTVESEGTIQISYQEITGQFEDGETYSLRAPTYSVTNLNYGPIDPNVLISPRVGNQMVGLGLLELIPEADILANADEFDADGDGISGRPNYVWDPTFNATVLGRFGWKSNTGSLPTQVAAAFNGDIGIKTSLFTSENHTSAQSGLDGLPDGGTVEIPDDDLAKVVLYCRTLAVPARRDIDNYDVWQGQQLFEGIGCASCHTTSFTTGNTGDIEPLKNVVIRPYSDMLIHDMGPELADNRPDGQASGNEWRTQPLWGLGLIQTVNGHSFLLHDGRARNIQEAILWHGGEGEASRNAFKALNKKERENLLKFLESL